MDTLRRILSWSVIVALQVSAFGAGYAIHPAPEPPPLHLTDVRDREPQTVREEKHALAATKSAEEHAEPEIYVFTLPHYIRYPYDPERQHTLLKVGHRGTSVGFSASTLRSGRPLPEEPVLLRV